MLNKLYDAVYGGLDECSAFWIDCHHKGFSLDNLKRLKKIINQMNFTLDQWISREEEEAMKEKDIETAMADHLHNTILQEHNS